MQITKQTNPNECGICVINSLVQHHYHICDKNTILNEAKLTPDGLSIFNFEVLAQKFGLFAETFQLEPAEFFHLKHNEYFVCPIKKNGGLHYVIVKKHKQFVEVYDSESGRYESSYQAFVENFAGIIILITKAKVKINVKQIDKPDIFKHLDVRYLLINLLIQIVVVGLGAITADFLNIMINHAVVSNSLKNGVMIVVVFAIIYLLNGLTHYLLNLYTAKYFKINFQYLSHELINALNHKKKTFLNKVDANYFYIIDTAMHAITNFIVVEISSFCANVLLVIIVVAIICSVS
jgi:ABC-type bacteriocin/lantibiotic exporter with double-glycine peptidase domain